MPDGFVPTDSTLIGTRFVDVNDHFGVGVFPDEAMPRGGVLFRDH